MKVAGQQLNIRETVKVKLPRSSGDLEFTICSIPMGLRREYSLVYPQPKPPAQIVMRTGGKTDKNEDYDDPNFNAAFDEWRYLQNIYTFYRILEADSNVKFDNTPKDVVSLRLLEKEIKDAGFSDGDLAILLQQAAIASNITSEDIKVARANF